MATRHKTYNWIYYLHAFVLLIPLASSTQFGLISPIEVIEEWGCHDSEIRLTCSHLDSTIAILEATFTPNCSKPSNETDANEPTENCLHMDLKSLTGTYVPPNIHHRLSEIEAGRRFLETLRKRHDEDDELNVGLKSGIYPAGKLHRDELKRKRMTLRASLEEMIEEYLRGIAPESEYSRDEYINRKKRNKRNVTISELSDNEINVANVEVKVNKSDKINVENSTLTSDQSENQDSDTNSGDMCTKRRRRITQLDRIELNNALQNSSDEEYSVRQLLNYRCSGRNHCSFLFSDDHPFSVVWSSGTVRIKYICMENYRVNKYCAEHIVIANESPIEEPTASPHHTRSALESEEVTDSNEIFDENEDGPVAEALIQSDQSLHHLKILKTLPSEDRQSASGHRPQRPTPRKGIYSQDFRILKVLPSNLDDFNDIEKIGDEFYFKKEEDVKAFKLDNSPNEHRRTNYRNNISLTKSVQTTQATKYDNANIDGIYYERNEIRNPIDDRNNGLRDVH